MTPEEELQRLIYRTLRDDVAISNIVSDRIFDRVPQDAGFPRISFGPSSANEMDVDDINFDEHTFQVDIWSREGGKAQSKKICGLVKKLLHKGNLLFDENALVFIRVPSIRVLDDPDGQTAHGIVSVEAIIERKDR